MSSPEDVDVENLLPHVQRCLSDSLERLPDSCVQQETVDGPEGIDGGLDRRVYALLLRPIARIQSCAH